MIEQDNDYVLVMLNYCWADEFNVDAFWVTTETEYDSLLKKLSKCEINDGYEFYFGTNEYITFDSTEELINSLTVQSLSREEAAAITNNIGEEFGLISIKDLLDIIDETNNLDYDFEKTD
jgi:hypothetical protein